MKLIYSDTKKPVHIGDEIQFLALSYSVSESCDLARSAGYVVDHCETRGFYWRKADKEYVRAPLQNTIRIMFDDPMPVFHRNEAFAWMAACIDNKLYPMETRIVIDIEKPKNSASTGRVYAAVGGENGRGGMYPSVYGMEWIDREDQQEALARKGLGDHGLPSPTEVPCVRILFDNTVALSEGWDLFDVDGRFALQRIDCPEDNELSYDEPKFTSDARAIIFVALKANEGSAYHMDALERINTLAE